NIHVIARARAFALSGSRPAWRSAICNTIAQPRTIPSVATSPSALSVGQGAGTEFRMETTNCYSRRLDLAGPETFAAFAAQLRMRDLVVGARRLHGFQAPVGRGGRAGVVPRIGRVIRTAERAFGAQQPAYTGTVGSLAHA